MKEIVKALKKEERRFIKELLNPPTRLLQSHIDAALYYKVRLRMKQDKVKWRPLLEALLKIYLSEDEK